MTNLIRIVNGVPKVSTKQVADHFGKVHRDVVRAVNQLDCSEDFRVRNFAQSSYTSPQNKTLKCVDMTKDGFAFLCMGFTGKKAAKWKESYIEAFNKAVSIAHNEEQDLYAKINEVSNKIDDIKDAGSVWGKTGIAIRREKKKAITELKTLIDHAQLTLDFKA